MDTPEYEAPTIEKIGDLHELTRAGQRFNTDQRQLKDSAVAFESI
jgi:hypothetical protein